MVALRPTPDDVRMSLRALRTDPDALLPASAHQLQRAAEALRSDAGNADAVPTHGITLAHIEEALDRVSVAMDQMANAVGDRCGEQIAGLAEPALPEDARAVRWHLKMAAVNLRAAEGACAESRRWTRRLLADVPRALDDGAGFGARRRAASALDR
jgi:hypothetical protein